MKHILMVCLGNICRSPLAEGILAHKLSSSHVFVDSAGTANYHVDSPPDHRSIVTAKHHGIDISKLKARTFSLRDFDNFDYIFVMDDENLKTILNLAPSLSAKAKVKLILNEVNNTSNASVPDPYYGDLSDFENVYKLLDKACDNIAKKIKIGEY